MSKFKKIVFLFPFAIFAAVFIFCWQGLSINPQLLPSTLVDKPAPNFKLSTLDQPNMQLTQKMFLGHVTLLNVFATWCGICAAEHPVLMDIANTQQVHIVGIDYKDDRDSALAYLTRNGNPYQTILVDDTGQAAINWGVYGTPESYIIDKHGIVRYKHVGAITAEIWRKEIFPIILKYS